MEQVNDLHLLSFDVLFAKDDRSSAGRWMSA